MATNDYTQLAENLFGAMQTIYAEQMKTLDFNKTTRCSIVDDSKAEQGEYRVSDGSAEFVAYSETKTYKVGNYVYVLIPNNDYNQQKTIVGKYVTADSEYYTYVKPSDSFVDITNNIVDLFNEKNLYVEELDFPKDSYELIANGNKEELILYTGPQLSLGGFNRMAIKADFKSWLGSQQILEGNYGIAIDIITIDSRTTQEDAIKRFYTVDLDCRGFYGDPYNFENFYTQEAVVDISELTQNQYINQIQVRFYQKKNFINEDGQLIEAVEEPNLFVKNFEVHFGYALENFSDETVLLYTLKGDYYATYFTEKRKKEVGVTDDMTTEQINKILNQYNKKDLHLRWVHKKQEGENLYGNMVDGNDFISIDNESLVPDKAAVHWYQYDMNEGVYDDLAGAFWKEITPDADGFSIRSFVPDITKASEKFRVIIEYPSREEITKLKIQDKELMDWQHFKMLYEEFGHLEEVFLDKLKENGLEYLKDSVDEILMYYDSRLIKYEGMHRTYESEVLVFTNECPTPDPATIDLIQGLHVDVDVAGYNGVYRIYRDTGEIMNNAEATRKRLLTATYKSLVTGQEELDTAEKITWIIPTNNTMIYPPEDGVEYDSNVDTIAHGEDGEIEITRLGVLSSKVIGSEEADTTQQYFRIKEYYNQSWTNNSIICKLVKNNIAYEYVVDLIFGPCGTHGTDYTLTLEFRSKEPAATLGETAVVVPHLYDYDNNDITYQLKEEQFDYSWYSQNSQGGIEMIQEGTEAILKVGEDINACEFYILKLKLKNVAIVSNGVHQKTVTLTQYMPIPVRLNRSYIMFEGADKIAYNAAGVSPNYYKNPYRVYQFIGGRTEVATGISWAMSFGNDCSGNTEKGKKFYPQISIDGKLSVPSLFLQDNGKQIAVCGYKGDVSNKVWTQPLYLYQYVFDSTLLNSWDGNLTMDEENGTILSAMMGAGKKDSQNRFHGVLMGDVSKADNRQSDIGLFGYHEGQQSFGFNIDGTAFIGKNTKGQILMDGNSGRIQSLSYKQDKTGMLIDLDDGKIDIRGAISDGAINSDVSSPNYTSTQSRVLIQTLDPYLTIDTENGIEIMRVGHDNYYLKSEDFTSGAIGTKFDIAKGDLIFYDKNASGGYVRLRGDSSTYFRINAGAWSNNNDLMYVSGDGSFFIQSANWDSSNNGMRIDLRYGWLKTYRDGGGVTIDGNGHPYFQVTSTTNKPLITIASGAYFLQSEDFNPSAKNGIQINLNSQSSGITAYRNFSIWAESDMGYIALNSSSITPLFIGSESGLAFSVNYNGSMQVGKYFSVNELGEMICTKGFIAGWEVNETELKKGLIYLNSETGIIGGTLADPYFNLDVGTGKLTVNDLTVKKKAVFTDTCMVKINGHLGLNTDPTDDYDILMKGNMCLSGAKIYMNADGGATGGQIRGSGSSYISFGASKGDDPDAYGIWMYGGIGFDCSIQVTKDIKIVGNGSLYVASHDKVSLGEESLQAYVERVAKETLEAANEHSKGLFDSIDWSSITSNIKDAVLGAINKT